MDDWSMIRLIFRFKASARIACVSLLHLSNESSSSSSSSSRALFPFFLLYIYTFKSILKRSRRPTKRRKHAERRLLLLHHPLSSFATPLSLSLSLSLIEFRFHRPLFPLLLFFECDAYYYFFLLNPAAVFFCGPKTKISWWGFPHKSKHAHTRADKTEEHTETESSDELFLLLFFWRAHTQRQSESLRDWERAIKRRRNLSF